MKRYLLGFLVVGMLVGRVGAEPATVTWTEPTASGTLAFTTVYWCLGTGCVNWTTGSELRRLSDNGNGGDVKTHVLDVPINAADLPVVLRVRVTATNTSNNETSGVIVTHTFTE